MKKFLAVLLAMVMTVSLVACGGTQPGNENPTPEPTSEPTKAPDTVTDEISIDFEDLFILEVENRGYLND